MHASSQITLITEETQHNSVAGKDCLDRACGKTINKHRNKTHTQKKYKCALCLLGGSAFGGPHPNGKSQRDSEMDFP